MSFARQLIGRRRLTAPLCSANSSTKSNVTANMEVGNMAICTLLLVWGALSQLFSGSQPIGPSLSSQAGGFLQAKIKDVYDDGEKAEVQRTGSLQVLS